MAIEEVWYKKLEQKYGYDFCVAAGYFEETKPMRIQYKHVFPDLPKYSTVIQYSGAFHPLHEGHLSIIKSAIDAVVDANMVVGKGWVVLHVDHSEYRNSKGDLSEANFQNALQLTMNMFPYKGFRVMYVLEDEMPNGCSRNFTRLYRELALRNMNTFFLSGGDRANYALSFIDHGRCIIAGRESSQVYQEHKAIENGRIWFLGGDHPASSTQIRKELNGNK